MPLESRVVSSGHPTSLRWSLRIALALVGMTIGALILLAFGYDTGLPALLTGIICATLPVPIYAAFLMWIDRFEPEPPWLLATTFLWGALVAAFVAIIVNETVEVATGSRDTAVMFSAPIIEEFMKAVFLFILFLWRRSGFDGLVDGIVYAGMVALGFAMTENIAYYSRQVGPEGQLTAVFIVRGVMSPFAHPLFTCMTGMALGIARESRSLAVKIILPPCGLMLAMLLHFIWNASETLGGPGIMLIVYIVFMVPLFFSVVGIVIFALVREGRMIRRNLKPELDSGVLTTDDADALSSMTGRLKADVHALTSKGFSGWRARRAFHDAASLLAIHRHRIRCGIVDSDFDACAREQTLIAHLAARKSMLIGVMGAT